VPGGDAILDRAENEISYLVGNEPFPEPGGRQLVFVEWDEDFHGVHHGRLLRRPGVVNLSFL
jgi:hypothetical protein